MIARSLASWVARELWVVGNRRYVSALPLLLVQSDDPILGMIQGNFSPCKLLAFPGGELSKSPDHQKTGELTAIVRPPPRSAG